MSTATSPSRIVSMDQFRGYTVAGMFLVNFVGGLVAFPEVLKHHNGHPYFSYADSIMPSFMFAAGFSFRLVALRRLGQEGAARTYVHFVVRSLALVLISLVMYASEDIAKIKAWSEVTPGGCDLRLMSSVADVGGLPTAGKSAIIVADVDRVLHIRIFDGDGKVVVDTHEKRLKEQARQIEDLRKQLESLWPPHDLTKNEKIRVIDAVTSIVGHSRPEEIWDRVGGLLKADLWEVLAIIGVTQILILPVIAASARVRTIAWIACAAVHLFISYGFNFAFVYGQPNGLDNLVGLTGKSAWDGGFFGPIGWAIPMLFGTLAYDVVSSRTPWSATGRLLASGIILMAVGYALNCLGTLYDTDTGASVPLIGKDVAGSPVIPPFGNCAGPFARIAPGHPPVRDATTDRCPAAQLLVDEQENGQPAVYLVLLGIRPGGLCALHPVVRHLGPSDRGLSHVRTEPTGRIHHPPHGRGNGPDRRAQGLRRSGTDWWGWPSSLESPTCSCDTWRSTRST